MPDPEYQDLKRASMRQKKSIADLVRESIQKHLKFIREPSPEKKLSQILKFAKHKGPTGDIAEILAQIEKGRNL